MEFLQMSYGAPIDQLMNLFIDSNWLQHIWYSQMVPNCMVVFRNILELPKAKPKGNY